MKKRIKDIILHPLFSGSAMMIIGSNTINLINYIYHFVLGKLLGPANYGELVALISVIGLLGIIPGSLSLVIIKYISSAKSQEEKRVLINWLRDRSFKAAFGLFGFIIIISPLIVSFLHITQISYIFLVAIISFFAIPSQVNKSILQGLLKFTEMITAILIENLTKLGLAVLLVYMGFTIGGVMVSLTIAVIVGWYISKTYLNNFQRKKNHALLDMRPMILFTLPVMVQSFAVTSLISSDLILVKHFFSPYDAGIYSAISTLGKIIFFGAGPISSVMFPIVAGKQSRGEDHKKVFLYSFFATLIFALVLLFIYWLFPAVVISALYSSSYLQAKNLLIWFGIFMSLFTACSLLINYSLSLGKTRIVIFPLFAAVAQIVIISIYHQSLLSVIIASIVVMTLLLISLLIYLSFGKGSLWK